jgi:ubiquinone/menaquinone biosynthesis C-methylase UbiE
MSQNSSRYNDMVAARKRALLGDLHGHILEIGAGTGPNLSFYPRDVAWLGIEPSPAMLPYARQTAERLGLTIDLRQGTAEHLDTPDGSMDAVVSTLVLCSVPDPQQTLREILRVLKPGGRFVFMEHVAAPKGTFLRRVQSVIHPFWAFFSDGCAPDRENWTVIEQAGFSQVNLEHFRLDIAFVSPHIAGFAIK